MLTPGLTHLLCNVAGQEMFPMTFLSPVKMLALEEKILRYILPLGENYEQGLQQVNFCISGLSLFLGVPRREDNFLTFRGKSALVAFQIQ